MLDIQTLEQWPRPWQSIPPKSLPQSPQFDPENKIETKSNGLNNVPGEEGILCYRCLEAQVQKNI